MKPKLVSCEDEQAIWSICEEIAFFLDNLDSIKYNASSAIASLVLIAISQSINHNMTKPQFLGMVSANWEELERRTEVVRNAEKTNQ